MKKILSVFFLACCSCIVMAQDNVIFLSPDLEYCALTY